MFVMSTCAVSRYKFDRSQKFVMVQDLYCVQVRASGCKFWQDLSWEQGTAKTMTSPLIIPSVLAIGLFFFDLIYKVFELLNLESNRESFHIYMAIRSVQITARHLSVPKSLLYSIFIISIAFSKSSSRPSRIP
jgi:hypothetical protein